MANKTMTLGDGNNIIDLITNGNIIGTNIKNRGDPSTPVYFDSNGIAQPCTEISFGGSGSKYAAISVSYPTGAYCYCENEELNILYEATDTVGEYTFSIPEEALGTWKITVVMEANTMVRTVTLSEDNRTAHLNMPAFIPLYVDGVLTEEYGTFGMNASGYKPMSNAGDFNGFTATQTFVDDIWTVKLSRSGTSHSQSAGILNFNRPTDLTHVKSISIDVDAVPSITFYIAIFETFGNKAPTARAKVDAIHTELDVSSFNGNYYVVFAVQGTGTTIYIRDWRLIM